MHPASIGPFQVLRELGRGGMGEVFLARDTKLDRQVAIKALPAHLAGDPDRLARFQREAKVLASLSHPGIGAIYGLEEAGGHQYLILEFVEGETLADRLGGGPIGVEEALAFAVQIAGALEAAHEKGVIHRDLKPANVMVTGEGAAKVLDFGLARTEEAASSPSAMQALADSPTVPSPARPHSPTIPGVIMGTAGYMSPEQARGKAVDKRSDIFSFGCVLFEMLTGSRPFRGETVADALGATLHKELDFGLLPPSTPRRVRDLLTNCLAKDRRNRLHDIGDARLELERAIAGKEWASTDAAGAGRWGAGRVLLGAAACAGLVAGGWALSRAFAPAAPVAPAAPAQSFHLSTPLPAKPEFANLVGIAPDSRFVVYRARPELERDSVKPEGILMVRRLDRDETRAIEGTEGAMEAELSPDGRWLAFSASKDRARSRTFLKKIALVDGRPAGTAETLCELPSGGSPTLCWSSDREIVLALPWEQSILAVPASGGEPRVVLHEESGKEIDNWGELRTLVEGRAILATRWSLAGSTFKERTELLDPTSGKRTPLLPNAGATQYVPGGYLLARRNQNSLIAVKFDRDRPEVAGEPVTVWSGRLIGGVRLSPGGTLAMATWSGEFSGRRLAWLDETGRPQPLAAPARAYGGLISISPDGGRVVVNLDTPSESDLPTDLWVQDLTRRTFTRIPTQGASWEAVWSGDGQRIAYTTVNKNGFTIWERRSDGSGEPVKMHSSPSGQVLLAPRCWSPDGKTLAFLQVDMSKDSADVLMLEREGGSGPWVARTYLNSPSHEDNLIFSADGQWVRFTSDESGRPELYMQRFSTPGAPGPNGGVERVQVSTNGSDSAGWWSPDGKEIRYIDLDGQVMSVQVQTAPALSASIPQVLYNLKDLKARARTFGPDGRLLVVLESENERTTKIDLIVNFLDELRQKMPAAK